MVNRRPRVSLFRLARSSKTHFSLLRLARSSKIRCGLRGLNYQLYDKFKLSAVQDILFSLFFKLPVQCIKFHFIPLEQLDLEVDG